MAGFFCFNFQGKMVNCQEEETKKNTQKRETEGELPKKSAGLAVGRFTLLFGGHFLLDTHLHLALQS